MRPRFCADTPTQSTLAIDGKCDLNPSTLAGCQTQPTFAAPESRFFEDAAAAAPTQSWQGVAAGPPNAGYRAPGAPSAPPEGGEFRDGRAQQNPAGDGRTSARRYWIGVACVAAIGAILLIGVLLMN